MSDPALLARRAAVADLGAAVREVLVLIAASEAPIDRLQRATALAHEVAAELAGSERPLIELPSVDDLSLGIRFLSPTIGPGNPMSPPLTMSRTAEGVETQVTLDRRFEGPPGLVHGGITGLLLDEVLGQAATHAGHWGMTAFLHIGYHQGLPIDVELVVQAEVTRVEGRKAFVSGRIARADEPERAFVTAEALFVAPRPEKYVAYFDEITDAHGPHADVHFGAPDRARTRS